MTPLRHRPRQKGRLIMKKERTKKEEPQGFAASVWTLVHDLVYILAAITLVFTFAVRLVGVSGSSMYPTLVGGEEFAGNRGDYLALCSNVLKSSYAKGDIVVACIPTFEEGKPIVKRVIATEGQTVDLREAEPGVWKVFVDGVALDEPYIREPMSNAYASTPLPATVPEGCYFCMGDNRNNSSDSRVASIGMIDGRYIVGKAILNVLPGSDAMNGNQTTWSRFGGIG